MQRSNSVENTNNPIRKRKPNENGKSKGALSKEA
jgi:hypothetical protein